jgi:hypothetical protein
MLCSSQGHLKTRMHNLDHLVLASAKNTDKPMVVITEIFNL